MTLHHLIRGGGPLLLAGLLAGCAGLAADQPSPAKGSGEMRAVSQREAAGDGSWQSMRTRGFRESITSERWS